ncbi:hypothetical protein IQ07DRAFT_589575 [Pyrenochaeta sp. DS3sAY3a]|nr:hypothetical protein IQ07DRAFT_589575 [Pyrenochaeta sp. DS3sAY3a]
MTLSTRYLNLAVILLSTFSDFPEAACPDGLLPVCPVSATTCLDGSQPLCIATSALGTDPNPNTDTPAASCPKACDPHFNTCDATTAPSCVFPDPSVPNPRAACACRPGYKATGVEDSDTAKQWRLPINGQDYRVWVAEGVICNTTCGISTGVDSCKEVTVIDSRCIGNTPSVDDLTRENPTIPLRYISDEEYASTKVEVVENSATLKTYKIIESRLFRPLPFEIPFFHPTDDELKLDVLTEDLVDDVADSIAAAFPIVSQQLGIPLADAEAVLDATVPVLTQGLFAFFASPNATNNTNIVDPVSNKLSPWRLQKRKKRKWGISMKKIADGVSHVGGELSKQYKATIGKSIGELINRLANDAFCSTFVYYFLDGYLLLAASVRLRSPDPGLPIFPHQAYFLYPHYGNYPTDEGLVVHYSIPKGFFDNYGGITFNKDIYIPHPIAVFGPAWLHNGDFVRALEIIVHEIRHTKQYKAHGYSLASFGLTYTFQWCRVGFNYAGIDYEKQAKAEEVTFGDLACNEIAYSFFEFWNIQKLENTLGFPLDRSLTPNPGSRRATGDFELRFQHGVMQARKANATSLCHRVLNQTEVYARSMTEYCTSTDNLGHACVSNITLWIAANKREYICLDELQGERRGVPCVTGN